MDINQLQDILDQITFSMSEAKKQTTQMQSVAKFLATQLQGLETNKNNFNMSINESFKKMKLDILILQNKINDRLVFADECHVQKLDEITNAANETQKAILDFTKVLQEKISENIIEKVINQVNEEFKRQETSLLETTQESSRYIQSVMVKIYTYMGQIEIMQNNIEENSKNTLNRVNEKMKKSHDEIQVLSTNLDLINQSTIETLQTINQIENLKLWSGRLSTWLVISVNSFLFGVILTAIAATWYNPTLKAFIAAFLQK